MPATKIPKTSFLTVKILTVKANYENNDFIWILVDGKEMSDVQPKSNWAILT